MSYYTGSVAAVPTANKQIYLDYARAAWTFFQKFGATRIVENWGVDVPRGQVNDLYGAVKAKEGETVVFSWIEWPDRATADEAWASMENDSDANAMPQMPFDGSRMIFGGFEPILEEGNDSRAHYIQGFVLAVPERNKQAYTDMARTAWRDMFQPRGCVGVVEAWGVDVPRGKQTDFYRAALSTADEVPVFSWLAWPDKATCGAAAEAMHADMESQPHQEPPFDGKRMMWGGFEPLFDSARA